MRIFIFGSLLAFLCSCATDNDFEASYSSINNDDLARYVRTLASDDFMGRAPFTPGEKITVDYLAGELQNLGFDPVFDGSYFQEVPMVEITSIVNNPVIISTGSKEIMLNTPDEIAITSPRISEDIDIEGSEMVFAGFGIEAPEYGWNDFADLEVEGKTIVVLVNDPGLYTGDKDLFKGREMTYYGRWTYKFEEAARRGAAGVLIVHETEGAGYPYDIPRKSSLTPNLFMATDNGNEEHCLFTGWLTAESAKVLFDELGYDIDELRMDACRADFRGFNMETSIKLSVNNSLSYNSSMNVAGVLRGKIRPDEVIVYTGHWDHFGIGEKENGDSIYNGAVDNGTTMAMMFEIGEAFARLEETADRSIMLFFPTAEEQGLLGSMYYVENPSFSIEKTVACINNDLVLPIGKMKDVMVTGWGQSDLDNLLEEAAKKQDRYIFPDPNAHTGMYFRSDHFSFAKKGVPSMYVRGNCDSREFGKEWAAKMEADYINNKYHRPSDNYEPGIWDMDGIVEDAQIAFEIGYKLAMSEYFPRWKEGSEFKSLRIKE
ncbi:MAG TPA: M28 family peptidase [Bacteroidales bacterium]|nr:M28 family peptidase [Bacteroidales bacterium]